MPAKCLTSGSGSVALLILKLESGRVEHSWSAGSAPSNTNSSVLPVDLITIVILGRGWGGRVESKVRDEGAGVGSSLGEGFAWFEQYQ